MRTYQHKVNLENEIIHTNQAIMQDEQQKMRNEQTTLGANNDQAMCYGGKSSRGVASDAGTAANAAADKGGAKKTPKAKTAAKSGGATSAVKTSKLY